jgi:hypothetical protein
MLEVVGSDPPRFVPCPSKVRVSVYQFWSPQIGVIRRGYDDTEVIRVVGDASTPTSSRVMLRMGIGYSAFMRHQGNLGVSMASTERLDNSQIDRSIH